jgi:hypothetical protein
VNPSGLDLFIVAGSGTTHESKTQWQDLINTLNLSPDEKVIFLEDIDPGWGYYAGPRVAQSEREPATGIYTDINIVAHSEGAAATAEVLWKIADGASSLGEGVITEISGAALLEMPVGFVSADEQVIRVCCDERRGL